MTTVYSEEKLRKIFQKSFSLDDWRDLLCNFFKATELRVNPESISTTDETAAGYYLGNIDTKDGYKIGLFHYTVNRGSVANRRVGLRNLVHSFINPNWGVFDAALVTFNSGNSDDHWRLSFVSDIKGEETHPKRYSYVFGDPKLCYKTPLNRFELLRKKGISYGTLYEAFSVEALSNEFFDGYRRHYKKFVSWISGRVYSPNSKGEMEGKLEGEEQEVFKEFGKDGKIVRDYVKKMMGRIVFLHFLQKKGWLGVAPNQEWGEGDTDFMRNLFKGCSNEDKENFLDGVLEPMFSQALDSDRSKDHDIYAPLQVRLPYLNGGLFERDAMDEISVKFPAKYFEDLLEFFSEYNFTIDENDPDDAQIGIDPEMLGKIFEELLEDNKENGAYYTPKEIVQYMCKESLIAYLVKKGEGTLKEGTVRKFVKNYCVDEFTSEEKTRINELLQRVRICDPAIGSGAFPMGLLRELLMCRIALDDVGEQKNMCAKIKREILQNNIYGVDIDKGAIDIARLRFWLALIVDEENPRLLPNLDFKIMQGNSLLESYKGRDLTRLFISSKNGVGKNLKQGYLLGNPPPIQGEFEDIAMDPWKKSISVSMERYYLCTDHNEKKTLWDKIDSDVKNALHDSWNGNDIEKEITKLHIAGNRDFFMWHVWFKPIFNEGGFDIVIGNPPYVSTKGVGKNDKQFLKHEYEFSDDLYSHFFVKGIDILKDSGHLCYITSKTFWTTQTKKELRQKLLSERIEQIFDTGSPFDNAAVDTCITLLCKERPSKEYTFPFYRGRYSGRSQGWEKFNAPDFFSAKQIDYIDSLNSVIFIPTKENLLLKRIYGEKVKELYNQWWGKIKTSKDIEKNREELSEYRNTLRPGDITLLGCLTDGGQGMATGDNGRYLAVRDLTREAEVVRANRAKKLKEIIEKNDIRELKEKFAESYSSVKMLEEDLRKMGEDEVSKIFDCLKYKYGQSLGNGFIYKIASESMIANVDDLSTDEKINGISKNKPFYVPYDKGDREGNRWYAETPYVIAWTKENVHFLRTHSGEKGKGMPVIRNQQFYFKEGFCWNNNLNPNSRLLKARLKDRTIYDVGCMTLLPTKNYPSKYFFICFLNSSFLYNYYRQFVNCTVNVQIGDIRQIPVVVPNTGEEQAISTLVEEAVIARQKNNNSHLLALEKEMDKLINKLCIDDKAVNLT